MKMLFEFELAQRSGPIGRYRLGAFHDKATVVRVCPIDVERARGAWSRSSEKGDGADCASFRIAKQAQVRLSQFSSS